MYVIPLHSLLKKGDANVLLWEYQRVLKVAWLYFRNMQFIPLFGLTVAYQSGEVISLV